MTDITAIMTGHREGYLAGPSLTTFEAAIADARAKGTSVDSLLVLDNPDTITADLFQAWESRGHRVVSCALGDPGLARNFAAEQAGGRYIAFCDADDLWSFNWLSASYAFAATCGVQTVLHPELNIVFGDDSIVFVQADSESPGFMGNYLRINNYWDAMSFGEREIYRRFPFKANDLERKYGHEDWHWNSLTLASGISHRPVKDTVHFKRRRANSQSAVCAENDVITWPHPFTRFSQNSSARNEAAELG